MLPVYKLSDGPMPLLAFHGIGQDHRSFEPLAKALNGRFSVYAFDLFFHGGHSWDVKGDVLTLDEWQRILQAFLQQHQITRFSVVGFSMGGKFAMATATTFSASVDKLWLLAPDGITVSRYYQLATGTAVGRTLFRYFLKHMPLFHRAGQGLVALGLLNRSALRFAESMLTTPEQQQLVFQSWLYFRGLKTNLPELADKLNHSPIQVHFFVGSFDRVLPVSFLSPLTRHLHSYELTVLKTGHHRLIEKVARWLTDQAPVSAPATVPPPTPESGQ